MHTLRLKLEVDKNTAYIMEKRFRILAHISNQIRKHVKKLLSRLENDKQYQQALNEYMPERLAVCFTEIYLQRFACYSEARVLFKCLLAGAGIPRL